MPDFPQPGILFRDITTLIAGLALLVAGAVACLTGAHPDWTVDQMRQALTSTASDFVANGVPGGVESAKVRWNPGRWGLGWEVKGEKRRHWTGELTSMRTFCHFGHAGTLLWADPDHHVALAVFANRSVTHMWSFIHSRWARLSNAVVAAASW